MTRTLRLLRRFMPLRALGLAFIFGLFSVTVIAVGLTLHIPTTVITADVGGVFNTLGSALTGPIGGSLIGLMSGLMEPNAEIRLFVTIDKVLAGIWMGSLYWVALRRFQGSSVRFFIAWIILVFGYYYVARIPAFIGLKFLFPTSFRHLAGGSPLIPETLAAVDTALFEEASIVALLTGLALTVFPSAIRMPVWRSGRDYKKYLDLRAQQPATRRFPRSLSIRLTVWLLLLSLLPVMILSVFVWDDVTRLVYQQAAGTDERLAQNLAHLVSGTPRGEISSVLGPFSEAHDQSIWILDGDGSILYHPDSQTVGKSAFRFLDSSLVRQLLKTPSGSAVDTRYDAIIGYTRVGLSSRTLLVVDPTAVLDVPIHVFHRSSYLRLGASMVLISIIGGMIMLILVEVPMKRLTKVTTQVGRGNFSVGVRESDLDDEIAVLGNRFNGMVKNLRSLRSGLESEIRFRRGVEGRLRESEGKYRTIIEQSFEGIILIDSDGTVIECNRACEAILGLDRSSMVGQKTWDIFRQLSIGTVRTESDVAMFREATLSLIQGRSARYQGSSEVTFRRSNGDIRVIQQTIFPIRREAGNRLGVILQDITGRKENEEALRRSEEKFSRVFHTTPDSVTITRLSDGRYIDINEGFTSITGYCREEVIGKTSRELGLWVDDADRQHLVSLLKRTGEVAGLDGKFRMKDGSTVYALLSARVIQLEGEECLLLIARDVTERRRAEEALRESEERFRSVFEHAAVGICYASLEGRLLRVNHALCKITGYADTELTRLSFAELSGGEESVDELDHVVSVLRDGIPSFTLTRRYTHKSGKTIWVNMTMSLIRDAAGKPQSFIGIIENITERKKAEEEIERSLREKELLLKEIHHRVKNNLQIISSLLNLQSEAIRDSEDRSLFRDSQDRIRSMALIHEKLYQTDDFAHVDFQQYLKSLLASLFRSYRLPQVACVEHIEDIRLNIDAAIPCGLIVNELVTNALKHAFPDGQAGEVCVAFFRNSEGRLVLEVSDNGVGMPASTDAEMKEQLGLELVSILTKQIDGQLAVEHGHGTTGTTFRISFAEQ